MSTWTSKTRAAALGAAAVLLLAGCVGGNLALPFAGLSTPAASPAGPGQDPPVLAGAVTVAPPAGQCIASLNAPDGSDSGFALLTPCRGRQAGPAVPAVLTVSVLGAAGPAPLAPDRLDSFFRSEVGRAALSRAGDASTVEIVQSGAADGVYFVHVRDSARLPGVAVAPDAWRAVLPLNGRLVALTALSPADRILPPVTLRSALDGFVAGMRAANAPSPKVAG